MSPLAKDSKYAFCMKIDASPLEPFHLREVGPDGPQFSGGKGAPLCGDPDNTWGMAKDLDIEITGKALFKACKACAAIYWERAGESWVLNSLRKHE